MAQAVTGGQQVPCSGGAGGGRGPSKASHATPRPPALGLGERSPAAVPGSARAGRGGGSAPATVEGQDGAPHG